MGDGTDELLRFCVCKFAFTVDIRFVWIPRPTHSLSISSLSLSVCLSVYLFSKECINKWNHQKQTPHLYLNRLLLCFVFYQSISLSIYWSNKTSKKEKWRRCVAKWSSFLERMRRLEFKSWTRLLAFRFVLMSLRKNVNPSLLPPAINT